MSSLTQHCHHDILFNDCHLYDKAEFFLMLSPPLFVVFWWQHYMELLHEVYSAMNMTMRIEPGLPACVASSLALIVSRLPSSAALLTFAFFVIIIMIRLCCQVKDLFSCAVMIYDGIITIHHHYLICSCLFIVIVIVIGIIFEFVLIWGYQAFPAVRGLP